MYTEPHKRYTYKLLWDECFTNTPLVRICEAPVEDFVSRVCYHCSNHTAVGEVLDIYQLPRLWISCVQTSLAGFGKRCSAVQMGS